MTATTPHEIRTRPERLTNDDDLFIRMEHALGLPVVNQAIWRLPGTFDRTRFAELAEDLRHGRLSKLVKRTPFPLRDRWIHTPDAGRVGYSTDTVAAADCLSWAATQLRVGVDSVAGPSWSLAAAYAPDTDETLVSWVSSHSIGDGGAVITGVEEACRHIDFDTANGTADLGDAVREGASALATSARAAWQLARRSSSPNVPAFVPKPAPVQTTTWSGINPSIVVSLPDTEFDVAAKSVGGTANTLFTAIVLGILEATGAVGEGDEIGISLPMSMRTATDRRANATTGVTARVWVDSARYGDLTPIRTASKAAYRQPQDGPGALTLLGQVAQPLGDGIVRKLAADSRAPLCLASNLGELSDAFAGLGAEPGRVAMRSMTVGASLETMRRMAGGVSGWSSRSAGHVTLCVTALDPDRVADVDVLSALVRDELGKWGITATFWGS